MSPGSTSALAPERGTGDTGDTPAHPPPLAPGSPWDVELVWSPLVPPAPKRTQNVGHKPQKATTGPLGPPGVTSHHPTPPQISFSVPLRGRLCPLSILPPLVTLDLEASHRSGCGRRLRPALVPVVPRRFLHKHWNLLDTGALFPARNAGVWPGEGAAVPGPTGSRTLELLLLLLAPQTPGTPDCPLGTREGAASTSAPSVPSSLFSSLSSSPIWTDRLQNPPKALRRPCHAWGHSGERSPAFMPWDLLNIWPPGRFSGHCGHLCPDVQERGHQQSPAGDSEVASPRPQPSGPRWGDSSDRALIVTCEAVLLSLFGVFYCYKFLTC